MSSDASDDTASLDTGDLSSTRCGVCELGARPPSIPAPFFVNIPAPGLPVASVATLVVEANALEHEVQMLRTQLEVSSATNAGLAIHAATLHDRRAREGFDMVGVTLSEAENVRLSDFVASLRQQATRADEWETKYRVLTTVTAEQAAELEDALVEERARVAELSSRLSSRASSPARTTGSELSPSPPEPSGTPAPPSAVASSRGESSSAPDEAVQDRAVESEELSAIREALRRSQRDAAAARALSQPFQSDLQRVNALLVAHAEEHQRDVTRIHNLEISVSAAEVARVAAQAYLVRAQAEELRASSRSVGYRSGLVAARRKTSLRRTAVLSRSQRLDAHNVELERQDAQVVRERDERTTAWRRLLREARLGRESARRVRDALATRLMTMVFSIGGSLDVDGLLRDLEADAESAANSAVRLPPDDLEQACEDTGAPDETAMPSPTLSSLSQPVSPVGSPATASPAGSATPPSRDPSPSSSSA
uniref:Uncharacterized protein n=1 Tax=Phytophthora ramorum TaxID=164328 RepID=H3GXN5_PHYRM